MNLCGQKDSETQDLKFYSKLVPVPSRNETQGLMFYSKYGFHSLAHP